MLEVVRFWKLKKIYSYPVWRLLVTKITSFYKFPKSKCVRRHNIWQSFFRIIQYQDQLQHLLLTVWSLPFPNG